MEVQKIIMNKWNNVIYWLNKLEELDFDGGRLSHEEYTEEYDKIINGLRKVSKLTNNKEIILLIEELIDMYENEGYYDYGGEEEKLKLKQKIQHHINMVEQTITKLNKNNINEVDYKIATKEFTGFGFTTNKYLYLEDIQSEFDTFRLEINPDGSVEVFVANSEDYSIHDDVTEYFDVNDILIYLKNLDVYDATEEYINWRNDVESEEN